MKLIMPSRVSRRLGERFFFKAERDASPKSAMARRPYPPGMHAKTRRRRGPSEYGAELAEKQKVRFAYGLADGALKRYVRATAGAKAKTRTQLLTETLERRLDNVVYRLGLAPSRRIARHLVAYGHLLVNGRPARSPGMLLRPGDRVSVRESSRAKLPFHGLDVRLKRIEPPGWLRLDPEALAGSVKGLPSEGDAALTYNLVKVIGYYSR